MEEPSKLQIPRVKLGSQGLEVSIPCSISLLLFLFVLMVVLVMIPFAFFQVSRLGFGCMGLTGVYNAPVAEEAGISIIKHAFNEGITFFDTADAYGPHTNEILIGKVQFYPLSPLFLFKISLKLIYRERNWLIVNGQKIKKDRFFL